MFWFDLEDDPSLRGSEAQYYFSAWAQRFLSGVGCYYYRTASLSSSVKGSLDLREKRNSLPQRKSAVAVL
ncbi:hypothetical protein FGK64_11510 [Arenibacterium halophilum]|uniref:Uncharacterized protein n=1 Tax=Arenibacterium halophilum TaxID=2583821 RepID=A0ABY2XAK9_9RHOB|nr:hypothetical protein FGK64_11510 [Arenibacterium halophilum]